MGGEDDHKKSTERAKRAKREEKGEDEVTDIFDYITTFLQTCFRNPTLKGLNSYRTIDRTSQGNLHVSHQKPTIFFKIAFYTIFTNSIFREI